MADLRERLAGGGNNRGNPAHDDLTADSRRVALDLVHDRDQAERIADDVVKLVCRGRWFRSLVVINDFSSHKRVLALFDRAIERV